MRDKMKKHLVFMVSMKEGRPYQVGYRTDVEEFIKYRRDLEKAGNKILRCYQVSDDLMALELVAEECDRLNSDQSQLDLDDLDERVKPYRI